MIHHPTPSYASQVSLLDYVRVGRGTEAAAADADGMAGGDEVRNGVAQNDLVASNNDHNEEERPTRTGWPAV